MKSLVIYYSHSGNTTYVSDRFKEALNALGHTEIFELDYFGGKPNVFIRFFAQFFPFLVKIKPVTTDLKNYDVLFLGISVLTNRPSAALIKYMYFLKHLVGKKIICCYVYGIKSNAKNCAKFTDKLLTAKGSRQIIHVYADYNDIFKENFLSALIADALSGIK